MAMLKKKSAAPRQGKGGAHDKNQQVQLSMVAHDAGCEPPYESAPSPRSSPMPLAGSEDEECDKECEGGMDDACASIPAAECASFSAPSGPAPSVINVHQQSPPQRLATLVALQSFDGSFSATAATAAALGLELTAILDALPRTLAPAGIAEADLTTAWATALAIAYMRVRLAGLQDDWVMVADKAAKRLRALLPGVDLVAHAQATLIH